MGLRKNKKTNDKKIKQEIEVNEVLFETVQPKGGLTFKEPAYITAGDGYIKIIHVYGLPSSLNDFWLINLFNIHGSICNIDISTKNMFEVKKNLNRSIGEEKARSMMATNHMELYDAEKRSMQLQALFDEISSLGEVLKVCDMRIFVKAKTLAELDDRLKEITQELESEGYKTTVPLNEMKDEFLSFYKPAKLVHTNPFVIKGLDLTTEQLAIGYPFNYSELIDEEGTFMGFTNTGGVVIFDEFAKTNARKHYNSIVCGDMGSGKSTLLKKRFKANASVGNFVRVFDVSGEFTPLVQEFGGRIIRCDGSNGMLNPLEILKSGDDDYMAFSGHIGKLKVFFQCLMPEMDAFLQAELEKNLHSFYEMFNLTPQEGRQITGLDPSKYPTMSHFAMFLQEKIADVIASDKKAETTTENRLNQENAQKLTDLLTVIDALCKNFGHIFDGTSTIKDISNEQIVSFDISQIKDLGNPFVAQMQNMIALCWANAVKNGEIAKYNWETGLYKNHEITKFLVLIDESHRWVNTNMPYILEKITQYMREARKYFAGITLASQSVRDFMPEATSDNTEMVKKLFELTQYKIMFKQDSSVKKHLESVFGDGLTFSQIENIPTLEVGQAIMCISGDRSLKFDVWLSKAYEEGLFSGGR